MEYRQFEIDNKLLENTIRPVALEKRITFLPDVLIQMPNLVLDHAALLISSRDF